MSTIKYLVIVAALRNINAITFSSLFFRYLPMHREIYGYSPRQLYPHQYKPVERFIPGTY